MAWIIIIALLTILDQVTKYLTGLYIASHAKITVINGFFYLTNVINKGAAWSLLGNKSWGIYVLSAISFVAALVLIYLIFKLDDKLLKFFLSLVCAGTLGNLIDRVFYGGVTDFLEFHFGAYIFPVFNVADCLIVLGGIGLAVSFLFIPKYKEMLKGEEKEKAVGDKETSSIED